jgi:hypothetical protein
MVKTIKVRIPAVVSPDGKWAAYGWPDAMTSPDWAMVEEVADNGDFESTYQRIWITVELPLPEKVIEVAAEAVEQAQPI